MTMNNTGLWQAFSTAREHLPDQSFRLFPNIRYMRCNFSTPLNSLRYVNCTVKLTRNEFYWILPVPKLFNVAVELSVVLRIYAFGIRYDTWIPEVFLQLYVLGTYTSYRIKLFPPFALTAAWIWLQKRRTWCNFDG